MLSSHNHFHYYLKGSSVEFSLPQLGLEVVWLARPPNGVLLSMKCRFWVMGYIAVNQLCWLIIRSKAPPALMVYLARLNGVLQLTTRRAVYLR